MQLEVIYYDKEEQFSWDGKKTSKHDAGIPIFFPQLLINFLLQKHFVEEMAKGCPISIVSIPTNS